jgi:hypothetical protein
MVAEMGRRFILERHRVGIEPYASFALTNRHRHDNQVAALGPMDG